MVSFELIFVLTNQCHPCLICNSGIQLLFEGRAKCHWEVRQGRSKTDYRAGENYLNEVLTLYGGGMNVYFCS